MDIYKIKDTLSTKRFRDIFCGVLVLIVIVTQMFLYSTNGWNLVLNYFSVANAISRVLFIAFLIRYIKCDNLALKAFFTYFLWYIISKILCGDTKLTGSLYGIYLHLFLFCLLYYSYMLDGKSRKEFFLAFSSLFCLFFFIIAIAMLYVAVSRTDVSLPLCIDVCIKTNDAIYVTLPVLNRNETAALLCMAFCLTLCIFAENPNKWIKVCSLIIAFVLYAALGLTRSRASMLGGALALTMAVILFFLERINNRTTKIRVFIAGLLTIALIPFAYTAFNFTGYVANGINDYLTTEIVEEVQDNIEVQEAEEKNVDEEKEDTSTDTNQEKSNLAEQTSNNTMFVEKRSTKRILGLSGRTSIWYVAARTLKNEPERLKFGSLQYMDSINNQLRDMEGDRWKNRSMPNLHNSFFEVLIQSGVVGFFFFSVFVLILFIRMIKVFFYASADVYVKMLTLPLTAAIINNMAESELLWSSNVTNYIFFLVAGIFLSYSYELFPEKKRWGRRKGKAQSANDASSTAIDEAAAKQTLAEQVTL